MASTFLSRTLGTPTSSKIWTFSTWIKRSGISSGQHIFSIDSGSQRDAFSFDSDDGLRLYFNGSATGYADLSTNRVLKDTSAFYNLVLTVDTTQATAANRVKLYINGTQYTWDETTIYGDQNYDTFNASGNTFRIGRDRTATAYLDGILAHTHFIDGTAYAASDFGETDSTSGIWKPKTAPSVTYGNNGFFLKFENSGAMGTDSSGNGNNFTVSGTLTQNVDTPSNNFATLNPLYPYTSTGAFTNGNTVPSDYNGVQGIVGTLGVSSGKWYFEVKASSTPTENMVGWGARDNGAINFSGGEAYDYCRYLGYANYYNNGSATAISGASAYSGGDICGCALDLDGNKIYWYKNGVLENTGGTSITASSTAGNYFPLVRNGNGSNIACNFGNGYFGTTAVASSNSDSAGLGLFEYSVPSGYYSICTKNIKDYG